MLGFPSVGVSGREDNDVPTFGGFTVGFGQLWV